jgi:hypothetical protein
MQGRTEIDFFMLLLEAKTSFLKSIDTWNGVVVKMTRMMML